MSTISVWVLVFYMGQSKQGGPSVIDNISTVQECQRVAEVLNKHRKTNMVQCIEVRKVKQ